MAFRGCIPDFQIANPLYVGATVSFFTVDASGNATTTLATLFADPTSPQTVINPQTLDSEGKFEAPVYIELPVIAQVSGPNVPSHTTGVINARGTWRGDWAAATIYFSTDFIQDPATGSVYAATLDYTSSSSLVTDISAGNLKLVVDQFSLLSQGANIAIKIPVKVAATGNITLSGLQNVDNVAVANNDRVLAPLQNDPTQNGIYNVNAAGAWTRSTDFNANAQIRSGTQVVVANGDTWRGTPFELQGTEPLSIGTSALTFVPLTASFTSGRVFNTIAELEAAKPPAPVMLVDLLGYYSPGGISKHSRRRDASGDITSADGAKWAVADSVQNPFMYGAVGDFADTHDDAPPLRACVAATPDGGVMDCPGALFLNSVDSNGAVVTLINKAINMRGFGENFIAGGSTTTPRGSLFRFGPAIPDGADGILLKGTRAVSGFQMTDLALIPYDNAEGSGVGRDALRIDATGNDAFFHNLLKLERVFIGNMKTGYSIRTLASSNNGGGALANAHILDCVFMCSRFENVGDNITVENCAIGPNATADSRNTGIYFYNTPGATDFRVIAGAGVNFNGMIVCDGGTTPLFDGIEMEDSVGFANARGAMIDMNGGVAQIVSPIFINCGLSQGSVTGTRPTVIRFNNVDGGSVSNSRLSIPDGAAPFILQTALSLNLHVDHPSNDYFQAGVRVTDPTLIVGTQQPSLNARPPQFNALPVGSALATAATANTIAVRDGSGGLAAAKFNGNTLTPGTGTLTIAAGKTLTASNTLTMTNTDGSTAAFGAGGTVAYQGGTLAQFAATTSAQLAGVLSDETGSASGGLAVFNNAPAIMSPTFSGTVAGAGTIPNTVLVNSSTTINGTAISLGASGTVAAAAGTLTGGTLAAGVTASSLTSLGTIASLTATAIGSVTPGTGAFTTASASTSITSPVHIGGSAAGSSLELRATSGVGIGAEKITWTLGNNGSIAAGQVSAPATFTGLGTAALATLKIGGLALGTWGANTANQFIGLASLDQTAAGNYNMIVDGTTGALFVNVPSGQVHTYRVNNANVMTAAATAVTTAAGVSLVSTGPLLTPKGSVAVVNGLNSNIATPTNSIIRLTGPTGAFTIGGFTGGVDGYRLAVYNTVAQAMTIKNEDASSTAGNRIKTLTGADVLLRSGTSFCEFEYDSTDARWILIATN